jgi:hypothetical protein
MPAATAAPAIRSIRVDLFAHYGFDAVEFAYFLRGHEQQALRRIETRSLSGGREHITG